MEQGKHLGGYWLFWVTAFYVEALIIDYSTNKPVMPEVIQIVWLVVMSLPLWIPPLARYFNMKCIWEI